MTTTITKRDLYTLVDQAGNPRTEAWFNIRLDSEYEDGVGVCADLSAYFRRIAAMHLKAASGATLGLLAIPQHGTLATPTSAMIRLYTTALVGAVISGAPNLELTSGIASGQISGKVCLAAHIIGY